MAAHGKPATDRPTSTRLAQYTIVGQIAMAVHRFSAGSQFRWHQVPYKVLCPRLGDTLEIENLATGVPRIVERAELTKALFAGELVFEEQGRRATPSDRRIDLSNYPPAHVAIARYRLEVIKPLLTPNRTRQDVIDRVQALNATPPTTPPPCSVSVTSIYRWIQAYTQGNEDLRALIPNFTARGPQGRIFLSVEANAILEATLTDLAIKPELVTIDGIYGEMKLRIEEENKTRPKPRPVQAEKEADPQGETDQAKQQTSPKTETEPKKKRKKVQRPKKDTDPIEVPGRATVARRLQAHDIQELATVKRGRKKQRQYGQMEYPTTPLERVEIDHTRLDLFLVDEDDFLPLGRPTLTYCVDLATRYPLGFYLGWEPPSYLTVMACLSHAIAPKVGIQERYGTANDWLAHGIPVTLVVDNGKEFVGADLQDACDLLGITLDRAPVRTPEYKAGIERAFGTINTSLAHQLPGTAFSSPEMRQEYDSVGAAVLTLTEAETILCKFIVDIYAQRRHRGLGGVPAMHWERATEAGFSPRLPGSIRELEILLSRVETRTVHHYGIELFNLRYQSSDLGPLRDKLKRETTVKIKYNPADLGQIFVYDPFQREYLIVPAVAADYATGLSLWKHRVLLHEARAKADKVDVLALAKAKRDIQEIVDKAMNRAKGTTTRAKAARWKGKQGEAVPASAPAPAPAAPPPAPSTPAAPRSAPPAEHDDDEGWGVLSSPASR